MKAWETLSEVKTSRLGRSAPDPTPTLAYPPLFSHFFLNCTYCFILVPRRNNLRPWWCAEGFKAGPGSFWRTSPPLRWPPSINLSRTSSDPGSMVRAHSNSSPSEAHRPPHISRPSDLLPGQSSRIELASQIGYLLNQLHFNSTAAQISITCQLAGKLFWANRFSVTALTLPTSFSFFYHIPSYFYQIEAETVARSPTDLLQAANAMSAALQQLNQVIDQ